MRIIHPTRLRLLLGTFFSLINLYGSSHASAAPPNVILIMADDMGYECVGANGGRSYQTPHLDQLAASGMRFENCHVQPLCTPTRVEMMTGLSNQRNYIEFGKIDPSSTTFAQVFQKQGYATCIAGKWQLGGDADFPKKMGFDEHYLWQHTRVVQKAPSRYRAPGLEVNGQEVNYGPDRYGPDVICDSLCDFIDRHQDKPFMAYYPMILPHGPWQPTPDHADWDLFAEKHGMTKNARNKKYFPAMVEYVDHQIGRVIKKLDDLQLRNNTLIIFTTDNGTGAELTSQYGPDNQNFRGGKGRTTHRGTHVPLICSWPGVIPAGKVNQDLINTPDFFPTMLEMCDLSPFTDSSLDGISFAPQLKGERGTPREWIYCWYLRKGDDHDRSLASVHVQNHDYKYYSDGRFYRLHEDRDEKQPVPESDLTEHEQTIQEQFLQVIQDFETSSPQIKSK